MKDLNVIGIMSGTSLDGVDLAYCSFKEFSGAVSYEIKTAVTIPYTSQWQNRLRALETASAAEIAYEHSAFGEYLGALAKDFIKNEKVDFISSHGHTIFHQPSRKFTFQLGSGAAIAAVSALPVVCDFRSKDVSLGGQGAPLVPIGDELLFNEFEFCLNLGGIANISYQDKGIRFAFDICPVNLVLNELSSEAGLHYDDKGKIASSGRLIKKLLDELNNLDFYSFDGPKSLGREYIVDKVLPLMARFNNVSLEDRMHTFCIHIIDQLSRSVAFSEGTRMLVTGGGAYNDYLISLMRNALACEVVLPDSKIIEFKEALIFAYLGVLRWEEKINTLGSVTGATMDSCGGCIYK